MISCATSAAKLSTASIRWRSAAVMSEIARASRPISSRALGQARHHDLAVAAQPHAHRGADQRAQRLDDGARQEQRQQDRDDQRDAAPTIASVWRASRTAWVMSVALRVVSSVSPLAPTGAAAVITGVRSGA